MGVFVQRGGTVMEVPYDQVASMGAQGWTSKGNGLGPNKLDASINPGEYAAYNEGSPDGRPIRPELQNLLDKNGILNKQYLLGQDKDVTTNKVALDRTSLNELQKEGMAAPGTSAWEQLMTQRQGLGEATARDKAVRGADTAKTSAYSDLATHGGLSTGSRERLTRGSNMDMATAKQDVARQGAMDRLGIGAQGEQNRLGILSALPGQQIAASGYESGEENRLASLGLANRDYSTGVQKTNIQNSLMQNAAQEAGKLGVYSDQMKAWAAGKTADAQANSGKK